MTTDARDNFIAGPDAAPADAQPEVDFIFTVVAGDAILLRPVSHEAWEWADDYITHDVKFVTLGQYVENGEQRGGYPLDARNMARLLRSISRHSYKLVEDPC